MIFEFENLYFTYIKLKQLTQGLNALYCAHKNECTDNASMCSQM